MKRSSAIRRQRSLKRSGRLRPRSEKKQQEAVSDREQVAEEGAGFRYAIHGERCVVCGKTEAEARRAGTRHHAHHAISKQRLKKLGLRHLLWDPRNAVCTCEEPCHRRHTDAVEGKRIPRAALPSRVEDFARQLGLEWVLEREYA